MQNRGAGVVRRGGEVQSRGEEQRIAVRAELDYFTELSLAGLEPYKDLISLARKLTKI